MIELCQISEQTGQPGVVRATPHQAHAEDGISSHRWVAVVGELAEGVEDRELGVGRGEEGEGEGHGTTDDRVTVMKLGEGERVLIIEGVEKVLCSFQLIW